MARSIAADSPDEIQQAIVELGRSLRRERRRRLARIFLGLAVLAFITLAVGSLECPTKLLAGPGP